MSLPESVSAELCAKILEFANDTGGGSLYRLEQRGSRRVIVHVPISADTAHQLDRLQRRRAHLQGLLEEVDAEISKLLGGPAKAGSSPTGSAPPRRASVPGAPATLEDAIRRVLIKVDGPMKLAHIRDAVLDEGYVTSSKSFRVIVGQRLGDMADVTKVGRGMYQMLRDSSEKARDMKPGADEPADEAARETPPEPDEDPE